MSIPEEPDKAPDAEIPQQEHMEMEQQKKDSEVEMQGESGEAPSHPTDEGGAP